MIKCTNVLAQSMYAGIRGLHITIQWNKVFRSGKNLPNLFKCPSKHITPFCIIILLLLDLQIEDICSALLPMSSGELPNHQ